MRQPSLLPSSPPGNSGHCCDFTVQCYYIIGYPPFWVSLMQKINVWKLETLNWWARLSIFLLCELEMQLFYFSPCLCERNSDTGLWDKWGENVALLSEKRMLIFSSCREVKWQSRYPESHASWPFKIHTSHSAFHPVLWLINQGRTGVGNWV